MGSTYEVIASEVMFLDSGPRNGAPETAEGTSETDIPF